MHLGFLPHIDRFLFFFTVLLLSPIVSFAQGSGDCLDFDGGDDHVTVNDPQSYAQSNETFTIECWVRSTDGSSNNNAFVTNYGGTGQDPFFMLGFDNSQIFFWIRNSSNTSAKATASQGMAMDGEWHHLAGVRSDDGTYLYVDGEEVASDAALLSDVSYGSELSMMDHYDRFTDGRLDEVRIWERALTQQEIRDRMCQKLQGSEADLYAYWNMDGVSTGAGNVTDVSGNGYDGTMQNMANSDLVTSGAAIGDTSRWLYPNDWAGGALDFDGSDDRVEVPDDASLDIQDELTLSFWFKLEGNSSDNDWPRPLSKGQTTPSDGAYGVFVHDVSDPTDIGLRFIDQSGNTHDVRSTSVPNYDDGNWHHVAAVYSNAQDAGRLYVDGNLERSVTISGNVQIAQTNDELYIGGALGSAQRHFNGKVDEARIWSRALDQSEIVNNKCISLSGSEPDLEGYWDLNGSSGGTAFDQSSNGNDGSLTNMTPSTDRVASNLTCSWSGLSLHLSSYESDSLSASNVSGSPDGIHIYHVESLPNTTNGIAGLGGNDHYYGTFIAGGSNPSYDATYYYRENDAYQNSNNTLDESAMALFKRANNADMTWVDAGASLDQNAKTLLATSVNTEFILGNNSSPLPVELLSFDGYQKDDAVLLKWRTASEQNADHYQVHRSANGEDWEGLGRVDAAGTTVNSTDYRYRDEDPLKGRSYYRLVQMDRNGDQERYGPIDVRFQQGTELKVRPNPTSGEVHIDLGKAREEVRLTIRDMTGRILTERKVRIGREFRETIPGDAGLYFLEIEMGDGKKEVRKVMKKE